MLIISNLNYIIIFISSNIALCRTKVALSYKYSLLLDISPETYDLKCSQIRVTPLTLNNAITAKNSNTVYSNIKIEQGEKAAYFLLLPRFNLA